MAELVDAAEVVEEITDEVVAGLRMISTRAAIAAASLTALTGAAAGYFIAEKRLREKYNQLAEEEIDSMREHFRARLVAKEVKPELSDLGKRVEDLGYRPTAETPPVADEEPETVNVFESQIVWDQTVEEAARTTTAPYVIHADERHERDYTETTLTYYAGDDVLCDDKDKVIEDQDMVVGLENLDRFGHGSNDPNIVYIRNDGLAVEVEVVRSERTYAEDVHGMTHSDPSRERRPNWDG